MKAVKGLVGWMMFIVAVGAGAAESQTAPPARAEARDGQPAGFLAAGTRFATPYYVIETGKPGPRLWISGGIHGDEASGAASAEMIRHWPITRGTLLVVPRANVPGLAARTRNMPGVETKNANLNRNFPRAGKAGEAPRGEAATALWEKLKEFKPDWVIDLHEGFAVRKQTTRSVGSSVIVTDDETNRKAAGLMLVAVNSTIADENRHFVRLLVPVDGTLVGAAGNHLKAHAMILETTSQGQPLAVRTRQHRTLVYTLFKQLGMLDGKTMPEVALRP